MNGNGSAPHAVDGPVVSAAKVPSLQNYINGEFVDPVDGAYLDNPAPATGALLCRIPRSNKIDVDRGQQPPSLPCCRSLSLPVLTALPCCCGCAAQLLRLLRPRMRPGLRRPSTRALTT